jgi:hypothetical protein
VELCRQNGITSHFSSILGFSPLPEILALSRTDEEANRRAKLLSRRRPAPDRLRTRKKKRGLERALFSA